MEGAGARWALLARAPVWASAFASLHASEGETESEEEQEDDLEKPHEAVCPAAVTQPLEGFAATLRGHLASRRRLAIACLVLLAVGILGGMLAEGWSFITALYFIAQIITTVGYGDVIVTGDAMQIFMAIYVLLSLLVVANLLNIVTAKMIEHHASHLRQKMVEVELATRMDTFSATELSRTARAKLRKYNMAAISSGFMAISIFAGMLFYRMAEACRCPKSSLSLGCDDTTWASCRETGGKQLSWANAFYMSVVTVTTVGFGDYTPKTWWGRLFAVIWMVCGVGITGFFVGAISNLWEESSAEHEFESAENMSQTLFEAMDKDGNGCLTKGEYARYILLKHGLVPQEIFDDIDAKYDSMDHDRNEQVTWNMVCQTARRGTSPAAR